MQKLKRKSNRREMFMVIVAISVLCIGIGVYNVWKSFQKFDNNILAEKDTQFYSLIRSDDINIENSFNAFAREADVFVARNSLRYAVDRWRNGDDASAVERALRENTLKKNPVYADLVMTNKGKVLRSAEGKTDYKFLSGRDSGSFRLCADSDGSYYLAYELDYVDKVRFDALIDLNSLYTNVLANNPEREIILLDSTATVLIANDGNGVAIGPADAKLGESMTTFRDHMVRCQKESKADAISVEMTGENSVPYTARMIVTPSSETVNGEFAIAIVANYEDAIAPSRAAAESILLYGGVAMIGVIGLLLMVLYMKRENNASSAELNDLKKKNETMEEINQKMQALSHHQRLETIGTMTASIAHDFNNLLTPIMGYSIMTMEMLPADATDLQENLMEVYNASVKAKDIVTRLAELTKKSSEQNYRDLKIDDLILNSLKVTLPAKPKNVEVKANFNAGDLEIKADQTQISQLVMNIVLNAYDAMREEGGTIMVSTRQSGEEVLIKFKDTGCGMDADTVSRIFDPFYTTKESGKGTGLGLAIVAQIVETHGGRIYVDSEPGVGTEFRIYLPCSGSGVESLAWGAAGEGRYDTRRYNAKLFRQELAKAEEEKKKLYGDGSKQ